MSNLPLHLLFAKRVRQQPEAVALTDGQQTLSYAATAAAAAQWAAWLQAQGLRRGERVALWSENRIEYLLLELAAAQLGLIVACLNWRLVAEEQCHCITLVAPRLLLVSPRYAAAAQALVATAAAHTLPAPRVLDAALLDEVAEVAKAAHVAHLGPSAESSTAPHALTSAAPPATHPANTAVTAEDGLVILYTSGTTGLPKGALISQRAMVARAMVLATDYGITGRDAYLAWSPLFHMAANDQSLATLLLGGTVVLMDGLDVPRLCDWLVRLPVGWLMAMPGMTEALIAGLQTMAQPVCGVRVVGAMADLVPGSQVAELTRLLRAPYMNTFGSTETGLPPASAALLAPGVLPTVLAKRESSWCAVRLVGADGNDVPDGTPGELWVRGPTLFSGYWGMAADAASGWHDGWFAMGDLMRRHPDGTLDFVDRLKYLIKSGGENIYPAEIERVLLAHPAVCEAAVVRQRDPRWGEVPVAFVACDGATPPDAQALLAWCRDRLAHYKLPRELRLLRPGELPRNSTGKILRHEVERRFL